MSNHFFFGGVAMDDPFLVGCMLWVVSPSQIKGHSHISQPIFVALHDLWQRAQDGDSAD